MKRLLLPICILLCSIPSYGANIYNLISNVYSTKDEPSGAKCTVTASEDSYSVVFTMEESTSITY